MKKEHEYYNQKLYKKYIDLELFGLAFDYAKNAVKSSENMCGDCEQMELVDGLVDALSKTKLKLFKRDISKADLRNVLLYELHHSNTEFGESLKTRQYLQGDALYAGAVVVDGYHDGYLHKQVVKRDSILALINRMKGLGTEDAYNRFLGIESDSGKSLEDVSREAIENNPKFEEVVNKLIKDNTSPLEFQMMIEMYIKRNLELNKRLDCVSKMLAKGFGYISSKMVRIVKNILTNEDVESLVNINPRVLFNINVSKNIVKERNKIKRFNLYQAKLEEQKRKRAEEQISKQESGKLLTAEQHCSAINDQVRNLTRLVTERKKNFSNIGTKEGCYIFDVVDFLMANRYSFETLKNIVIEKIKYFKNHPVYQFYGDRLEQTLKFLEFAEKHSTNQPVNQMFSYILDDKIRETTGEEVETVKKYLTDNNVVINPYTVGCVLKRLVVGGDINSKYERNCLQIKKNVAVQDDIPLK